MIDEQVNLFVEDDILLDEQPDSPEENDDGGAIGAQMSENSSDNPSDENSEPIAPTSIHMRDQLIQEESSRYTAGKRRKIKLKRGGGYAN